MVVVAEETPPPEQIAAASEAAVEIAEIQADRDVELATINAESNEAQTDAVLEAQADEDEQWLREELDGLRASHATHAEELSNQRAMLEAMQAQHLIMSGQLEALMSQVNPPMAEVQETPQPSSEQVPNPNDPPAPENEGHTENEPDSGRSAPTVRKKKLF